jgi:glucoside 3-dehydrogenase (cytochrome c) hitch-hiker subunit
MKRRTALQLIAIGAAAPLEAQHAGHAPAAAAAAAETAAGLRFFSPAQNALVDRLAEMILPADDHSPGAHDAQVSAFIDSLLADSEAKDQQAWTAGLAAVEAEAKQRFEKPFLECAAAEQDQILGAMAEGEENPASPLQRFFVQLKQQTISGYYTSRIGLLQELEYKGIVPIPEYKACDHPEHSE